MFFDIIVGVLAVIGAVYVCALALCLLIAFRGKR